MRFRLEPKSMSLDQLDDLKRPKCTLAEKVILRSPQEKSE